MFFIANGLRQNNMATEEKRNRRKASSERKKKAVAGTENASPKDFSFELSEPRWSVISFEECVAKNLTYARATEKLKQLEAKKVAGLCIVTNEAAARIFNNDK